MGLRKITATFESLGAEFLAAPEDIATRLSGIRAILFDWDGVFNTGTKIGRKGSPFSEEDSMGLNMLRLGLWLRDGNRMPVTGIITGATNKGALYFAKRESIDVCIRGFTNKHISWSHFLTTYDIRPAEVAFVFDDILDLPIALDCGLRFCVRRSSSPAFLDYLKEEKICDYITGHAGGSGAVREISEMLLSLMDIYDEVVKVRVTYQETYTRYLEERKAIKLHSITPD